MKFALLFPGQGSQSIGMLSNLAARFPVVETTFAQASAVLNYDLWGLVQNGPEQKLNQTEFTQPALLAADIAVWRCWLLQGGDKPSVMAGHSLGEYAALVAAEALSFTDAIELVAHRGRYMQEAVVEGDGAMAAIVGLEDAKVQELCEEVALGEVLSSANFNSEGQVVIAGHTRAVERAALMAKGKGAKLAKLIPVSVPSHCELMRPAALRLNADLKKMTIKTPVIPVIHNVDVKAHTDVSLLRSALEQQLFSPVRWVQTIQAMVNQGVTQMVECGPGKILVGLSKRISRDILAYTSDQPENLLAAIALTKAL